MATVTGTQDISSLLAARFTSAAEYGLDTIVQVLQDDLAAHNSIVADMVSELADPTTDRQRIYGTSVSGEMQEVDEYGRGQTQVDRPGETVEFPLRKYQFAIGWTEDWFLEKTPADVAIAALGAQKAHIRGIQKKIKEAIFGSSNYSSRDIFVDKVSFGIKRLVNADSANIPDGPNGESFDGATHTHYLARDGGSLVLDDILAQINHVSEHGHSSMVKIGINKADEGTIRALTGTNGFQAYPDPRVIYRASDTPGNTLDITRMDNVAIGIVGRAEVWVKPWVPAYYTFCWDSGSAGKPLAYRQKVSSALQGLRIAATLSTHPLVAQYMEAYYGFGVWERTNGAALYFGDTTYTDPTF